MNTKTIFFATGLTLANLFVVPVSRADIYSSGLITDDQTWSGQVFLTGNNIQDNLEYEIRNNGAAAMVADGNYWGEPTTTELDRHQRNLTYIYDARDNAAVGQVLIRSWGDTLMGTGAITITQPPRSVMVLAGHSAAFTVLAEGLPPLQFQWFKDGSPLPEGTEATLTLDNVTAAQAGNYTVQVRNNGGSMVSADARLWVHDPASGFLQALNLYPGLVLSGQPGQTYRVEYVADLNQPTWQFLTTVTLSSPSQLLIDPQPARQLSRFYRMVLP